MAIVVPIFLWSDIQGMLHYIVKKWHKRAIKKVRLLLVISSSPTDRLVEIQAGLSRHYPVPADRCDLPPLMTIPPRTTSISDEYLLNLHHALIYNYISLFIFA